MTLVRAQRGSPDRRVRPSHVRSLRREFVVIVNLKCGHVHRRVSPSRAPRVSTRAADGCVRPRALVRLMTSPNEGGARCPSGPPAADHKTLPRRGSLTETSRTRSLRTRISIRCAPSQSGSRHSRPSPHMDLGRAGPVCPFVPGALVRHTLWLAPERVADRSVPDVVESIEGYQQQFKNVQPSDGDDATYKSFVVVFTDLSVERATEFFADVLEQLAVPSYETDGFVMGGFHQRNEGTAIYNASFRPFTSPVPFLLVRQAVVSSRWSRPAHGACRRTSRTGHGGCDGSPPCSSTTGRGGSPRSRSNDTPPPAKKPMTSARGCRFRPPPRTPELSFPVQGMSITSKAF